MRMYLPMEAADELREALKNAESRIVYGTIDPDHGVATVSHVGCAGDASPAQTRPVISVLGSCDCPIMLRLDGEELVAELNGDDTEYAEGQELDLILYDGEAYFKRTPYDREVMSHLTSKRLLIIGLGSVGSIMAEELAASGVGTIIGMDKDILEIHNCMRHILGSAFIGWPKPTAMARYLREHSPECRFVPVYGDLFKRERRHELKELIEKERPTHILAVTDVLKVQYMCQRLAVEHGIPFMAVGCDNNAVEGEIFMWEPGQAEGWSEGRAKRGCYACLRPMDRPTITRSQHFDYSNDDPDSYGGEPALGTFINRINDIASIFMLAWLLRDCPKDTRLSSVLEWEYANLGLQYIRLGGPYPMSSDATITARSLWGVEWYRVRKIEKCPICDDPAQNYELLYPEPQIAPDVWE